MIKEAYDDIQRFRRDKEINNKKYNVLDSNGMEVSATCSALRVGNIVRVNQNERIPADLILLYTTERSGGVFIKTDQLDGETDWKLRRAIAAT